MDNLIGTPYALKQVNLSTVRRAIMENGSATRSEISRATRISVTTVRTILTQMLDNNEIFELGYDDSIGGRKATRYVLNKSRFFGVALCIRDDGIRYIFVDICGEIREKGLLEIENDTTQTICSFLDDIVVRRSMEIKSIGIGVPGIVSGLSYKRKNANSELETFPIGEVISARYKLPVILENDLNAVTMGFGQCYLSQFPSERCENVNMAYILFDEDCLSAGFLSNGKILRGWNNFVGELGLFPVNDTSSLDELLTTDLDDTAFSSIVTRIIAAICCVLNPQFIAVAGDGFRKHCLPQITELFDGMLPDKMSGEIIYADDIWHDYFSGMAHLTAEQIFGNVLLVQE